MISSRMQFSTKEDPVDPGINSGTGTSSRGDGVVSLNVYKPGFIDTATTEDMKMAIDRELGELSKALFKTAENTTEEIKEWVDQGTSGEIASLKEEIRVVAEDGKATAEKVVTLTAQVDENKAQIQDTIRTVATLDSALAEATRNLTAEIEGTKGSIAEESRVRADQDGLLAERIAKVEGSVSTDVADLAGRITEETRLRISADEVLGQRISSIDVKYEGITNTNAANIKNEETARVNADEAMTSRVNSMEATFSSGISSNSAAIKNEEIARATADEAFTSRINSMEADYKAADSNLQGGINSANQGVTEAKAAISAEQTARANADGALASDISNLSVSVDGKIAGVQQTAQAAIDATGRIEAKWGVTVDNNGKVAGIELNNGTGGSEFSIRADRFSFSDTSGTKSGGFTSSGGVTTFSGSINVADQGGNVGLKINNQQILVYDDAGRLRVKIGRLV